MQNHKRAFEVSGFDLILRKARLQGEKLQDIGIRSGRIVAIAPELPQHGSAERDLAGRVVLPGFVDTHIHLDKACILCRCGHSANGLKGAIAAVSRLKADFTQEDVYQRGREVIEKAIVEGTMHMRAHVEVDPRVGLRSFTAMKQLRQEYAFALDLQICVFPQEGLNNDPGAAELLEMALADGADLLGGCPYTDSAPLEQMRWLFQTARNFDVDLDLHLDFDLDPEGSLLTSVCEWTEHMGWHGRVAVGHATKLAAMSEADFHRHVELLRQSGVSVTALPSTDLYLNGRSDGLRSVRGVAPVHLLAQQGITGSIATNNVLNPFTPFGDCSLLRMSNLYANLMHLGPEEFELCLSLITDSAARLMRLPNYGLNVGNNADLVVLDATDRIDAFGGLSRPVFGYKGGRQTFERPSARIFREPPVHP